MRLKHNKKRNTAILYEALVRHLTKNIIKQNKYKINLITDMIKESFKRGSILHAELGLYKSLYETTNIDRAMAERLLIESKMSYKDLDKKQIFKEQSSLISKINKTLSSDVYKTFIPNYKNIASIHSIFNLDMAPKEKIILEDKVLEGMANDSAESDLTLEHIDNIVYNSFVEKFNKKYDTTLRESQKVLLNKFITSFADNGLELKIFLNEEIEMLKTKLKDSYNENIISEDQEMLESIKKVELMIEDFKKEKITDSIISKVIKIQDLVEEIQQDAN